MIIQEPKFFIKSQSCRFQDGVKIPDKLTKEIVLKLLNDRIESLDITAVKEDVIRFIPNAKELDIWDKSFFNMLITQIKFI